MLLYNFARILLGLKMEVKLSNYSTRKKHEIGMNLLVMTYDHNILVYIIHPHVKV